MITLNGKEVKITRFPNGETNVDHKSILNALKKHTRLITFKYESDLDLINLMFVKRYIDESIGLSCSVDLFITYMPYSRMDRSEYLSVFTLKYVAEFINKLNFNSVTILEPHSYVTPALIDNCSVVEHSIYLADLIMNDIKFDKDKDYIYFPDITAEKHYSKHFIGCKHLTGMKNRDFKTGEIKSLSLLGDIEGSDFRVILIDDLICKGGTCYFGAKKLKEAGAGKLYIAITHCENSIYEGKLFDGDLIEKIYTTDSILTKFSENDKLVVSNISSN